MKEQQISVKALLLSENFERMHVWVKDRPIMEFDTLEGWVVLRLDVPSSQLPCVPFVAECIISCKLHYGTEKVLIYPGRVVVTPASGGVTLVTIYPRRVEESTNELQDANNRVSRPLVAKVGEVVEVLEVTYSDNYTNLITTNKLPYFNYKNRKYSPVLIKATPEIANELIKKKGLTFKCCECSITITGVLFTNSDGLIKATFEECL